MVGEYSYNPYPTPDNLDSYQDWLSRYRKLYPYLFSSVLSAGGVKRILDGACGYGASTLAIGEAIRNAEIVAVGYDRPKEEVLKALEGRMEYKKGDLKQFLDRNKQPFDLINIAKAGYINGLQTAADYEVLKRNVTPRGYVVTVVDTRLDPSHMNSMFTPIAIPRYTDIVAAWQR